MAPPRRNRSESDARRSTATRERLLEAAFDCLVELGYARTTTVEICRRAGAPRGTLLHHYRSRDELIVAALAHVLERQVGELEAAFVKMARRHSGVAHLPADEVIDQLWKVVSGPTTRAWLELLVAARSDTELHARFKHQMREIDRRVRETYRAWFPREGNAPAEHDARLSFVFALLNGLSLDLEHKSRAEIAGVLDMLKALARAAMSSPPPERSRR